MTVKTNEELREAVAKQLFEIMFTKSSAWELLSAERKSTFRTHADSLLSLLDRERMGEIRKIVEETRNNGIGGVTPTHHSIFDRILALATLTAEEKPCNFVDPKPPENPCGKCLAKGSRNICNTCVHKNKPWVKQPEEKPQPEPIITRICEDCGQEIKGVYVASTDNVKWWYRHQKGDCPVKPQPIATEPKEATYHDIGLADVAKSVRDATKKFDEFSELLKGLHKRVQALETRDAMRIFGRFL
jgi:hypothetical protein